MLKEILLGTSLLLSPITIVLASDAPNTRQSNDYLVIKDDGNRVTAYNKTGISTITGLSDVKDLNEPLGSALKTTNSRFSCPDPYNSYKGQTQDIFPSKEWAKKWYANCMLNSYIAIEEDIAYALKETGARRAIYQYEKDVSVRIDGNPEDEKLTYTIVLDKNTAPGQGSKSGFSFVTDINDDFTNLYIKYNNPKASKLVEPLITSVDDHVFETHSTPNWSGNGVLHVYRMDGIVPEESNLELIEKVESSSFKTELIIKKGTLSEDEVASLTFHPNGVMSVLEYSGKVMEETGAELMVVDYGNPLSLKDYEIDNSEFYKYDLFIYMERDDYAADRTYDRDQCTDAPVKYNQYQKIDFGLDYSRERYLIRSPLDVADLTPSKLLNLDRTINNGLFELVNAEQDDVIKNLSQSYPRDTPPSEFSNQIIDYLGTSDEYFKLNCNESDANNDDCYEENGIFKNNTYYKSLGNYMDISRLNFEYKIRKSRQKFVETKCDKDEEGNDINCVDIYKTVYYWGGPGSYPSDTKTTYNSCPLDIRNRNEKNGKFPKQIFCGQSHIQCQ